MYMKTYNNLFKKIVEAENLFLAWDEFKKGKTSKKDVLAFEWELEKNIINLSLELQNKTYRHGKYRSFYIHDPKQRHIHKAEVRDRVLHHAIFRSLNPIFEPTFINSSYSCRIGKGTHKGVNDLAKFIRKASKNNKLPCFVLKCDIKKFFDSVNHKILLDIIMKRIKDKDVIWLVREVVNSYSISNNIIQRERERE